MKKAFLLFFLLFFVNSKAQIDPNSLFLVINKDNTNYFEKKNIKKYRLKDQIRDTRKVSFMHFTEEMLDYPARYILLLPQNIFAYFKRRNRILYTKDEEKKWQKMDFKELSEHFLNLMPSSGYIHYNEDYDEYIYQKRYNVFLIKEEDFDKEQVPCYEAYITIQERNE